MPDTETDPDEIRYFQQLEKQIPLQPIIDDDTAIIAAHAVIELVARRTPEGLGDNLAELHALISLLHQLHDWITPTIEDALDQHHTPDRILAQLTATPTRPTKPPAPPPTTTLRRRHVYNGETLPTHDFPANDSR